MGWLDSVGNYFGSGGSSGFDLGNTGSWLSGSLGSGWGTSGSTFDLGNDLWGSLSGVDYGSGSGDSGSSWGWLKSFLGGGGSSSGGGSGGNIWGSLLSGAIGGYGQGAMTEGQLKLQGQNQINALQEGGRQGRYNASYAAQLKDYYDQLDKNRKRTALDTYGQFSLMDRYAPNRTTVPAPQVPNYPTNG